MRMSNTQIVFDDVKNLGELREILNKHLEEFPDEVRVTFKVDEGDQRDPRCQSLLVNWKFNV